jgi:cobyrinic acid a,c-diamide synthase
VVTVPRLVLPRVVIAAPRSGGGKTTVTTGLMAALAKRGLRVSPHKVGPDYIDPSYHAAATGRPGRNLDPWLVGEDQVAPLFAHGATGSDVAVVEGVMGLFDGASPRLGLPPDFASTAHVARLLDAPVILVVDASGVSASVAALVHGFATFDPRVRLGGVVLNQVGSERHESLLREALSRSGIPVLGALRRDPGLTTPSRHLGLVPVAERTGGIAAWLDRVAGAVSDGVDLEAVMRVASSAPPLTTTAWTPPVPARSGHARIAVAAGRAFTFGYAETAELLAAAGAEVATFDPLTDSHLPEGTDGLLLGGGFPEVYAGELAGNASLRDDVRLLAGRGAPIVAECGGLLWLARSLEGRPQCGIVEADAAMSPRLTLGYREAVASVDSPLAARGTRVRGHEFHRTATTPAAGVEAAWDMDGRAEGWAGPALHASYLHLHWAGVAGVAERFVTAAQRARIPA